MNTIITDHWNEFLYQFGADQIDIYYYEEYVKLYQTDESKALCAICYEEDKVLLMPFIRREIDGYFDFETAYGYGGPIANSYNMEWVNKALREMRNMFFCEKYVCGFVRFHPLLSNVELCKEYMDTLFDRNTVAINTSQTEDEIWANQITSKNRNMIRKAEKNNLEYEAEYDFKSMNEFINLYNETMKRLGAEEFYYFEKDYYKNFTQQFENKAFLGTVRKNGELICAAIFMYSGKYGHYHLEGSNHNYSQMASNNLLIWKTSIEMRKLGVENFHLGGGYNSEPDNSLLRFKKAFSDNLKEFYIGKWIFNQQEYELLKREWISKYPEKYDKYGKLLLCYRY